MALPGTKNPESVGILQKLSIKLLRPVIGILMRTGVPFDTFNKLARRQYVLVARDEFGLRGRKTNTARVAMMTGLTRSVVKQEIDQIEADDAIFDEQDLDNMRHASRMLLGWHTDQRFLDAEGSPLPLDLRDGEVSFETLYDSFSGKVVPMTSMLKELMTAGSVEQREDGKYSPLSRLYKPQATDNGSLERICQAVHDLATTASHNIYKNDSEDSLFERFATNQLVPADLEAEFKAFLEQEGQAFLERADNWLAEHETDDKDIEVRRFGIGLYQISSKPIKKIT